MKLISISGLDGSGKSTQIKSLQKYLEAQDKKVAYFHAVQFSVANILQKQKTKNKKQETAVAVTKASRFRIWLRKLAFSVDLLRFRKYLKKMEREGCDFLLSDRYFYDNLINIFYLSGAKPADRMLLSKGKRIVRPEHAFYLSADPEQIMRRERVPEQGLAYLQEKKALFDQAAPLWKLKTIDGNRDKEEIAAEIRALL